MPPQVTKRFKAKYTSTLLEHRKYTNSEKFGRDTSESSQKTSLHIENWKHLFKNYHFKLILISPFYKISCLLYHNTK